MANLKDLKNRIESVKSTRKITKAMQMVAAAKLRRAQEAAEAGAPLCRTHGCRDGRSGARSAILTQRQSCWPAPAATECICSWYDVRAWLCGGFNSSIVKLARGATQSSGCWQDGEDPDGWQERPRQLRRDHRHMFVSTVDHERGQARWLCQCAAIAQDVLARFDAVSSTLRRCSISSSRTS